LANILSIKSIKTMIPFERDVKNYEQLIEVVNSWRDELQQTTHKNPTNQQILHPYNKQGVGKNINDPVDHKFTWKKDRPASKSYNKSTSSFSLESVDIKAT
jgi:hypothetical protein